MQTKRLTLDEYRKVNAVWLSNTIGMQSTGIINKEVAKHYVNYLDAYGVNQKITNAVWGEICHSEAGITSEQIEEIIADEVKHEMD